MSKVPDRQGQVLAFIRATVVNGQGFPRNKAIMDHMGWRSSSSVIDCLHALKVKGYINMVDRARQNGRGWAYTWELSDAGRVAKTETKTAEPNGQARVGAVDATAPE